MSPTDDDIRRTVLEFRASVTADLDSMHRRLDVFFDEMRDRAAQTDERVRTAETAILNEIRAMSSRLDLRLERIEGRLDHLEAA